MSTTPPPASGWEELSDGDQPGPSFTAPEAPPSTRDPNAVGYATPTEQAMQPGADTDPYAAVAPAADPAQATSSLEPYTAYPAYVGDAAQLPGHGGLYGSPYGSYWTSSGAYRYGRPAKSKVITAMLALIFGVWGAHSFYLGQKLRGLIHLGLMVGGFLVFLLGVTAVDNRSSQAAFTGLMGMLLYGANALWAFIEFIVILVTPESDLGADQGP